MEFVVRRMRQQARLAHISFKPSLIVKMKKIVLWFASLLLLGMIPLAHAASGELLLALANPASEYCLARGGQLIPLQDAQGNAQTMCQINGQQISEWTYYRENHGAPPPNNGLIGDQGNPASRFCVQQGGTLRPLRDTNGNTYTMCRLPNGEEMSEWTFYRQNQGSNGSNGSRASRFCLDRGGRLEPEQYTNGEPFNMCVLPDGLHIPEWTFFCKHHPNRCLRGGPSQ